jgi:GTP-binding protein
MFIDYARIRVKGGKGGNGCISFRREKFVPFGGPDGGNGGKGGDVIAIGDSNINTLLNFRYKKHFSGQRGRHGQGAKKDGKSGADVFIQLPLGTEIYEIDEQGNRINKLGDIMHEGERVLLARGGDGGLGNAAFATPTHQAPRKAEKGKLGEEKYLELVLKLMADAGLVGMPNAGKSTLISKISAAHPKIAPYEFTTLEPCLGVVQVDEIHSFTIADIPGVIEGAHAGKGLGDRFLRHIERTKILLFILDISSQNLYEQYQTLRSELHLYNPDLDRRDFLIVLNKIDLIPEDEQKEKIMEMIHQFPKNLQDKIIPISALQGKGLDELKFKIYQLLQQSKDKTGRGK